MTTAPRPAPKEEGHGDDQCVAVLAPFGQDGTLIARVLERTVEPLAVPDVSAFCEALKRCAVGVLTSDALDSRNLETLSAALRDQPVWSDVPLILLSHRLDPAGYNVLTESLGNVTVIERPLQASSLLSVVKTALRARQKQYQVRDLLAAETRQTEQITALNTRLQRAMTETHHRVKNSLQLISAFVEMQGQEHSGVLPVAELRRINSHIKTLAAVHEVLTAETRADKAGTHVSVMAILEHLFTMLASVFGTTRLLFEVEDVRLPTRQGTSLALVANELVLNALKHSTADHSVIEVTLKLCENKATLCVTDEGPGFPFDFDAGAVSTGLELIDSLVQWDLEGTVRYENRPPGDGKTGARVIVEFDATRWNGVPEGFAF